MERFTDLTPIQTPFTLMLPILIIHDARAPTIQVRALETAPLAQNGALKTALCIQTLQRARNGAARSKRRRAFKR